MIAKTLTIVSLSCLITFGALHAGADNRHDAAPAISQPYPEMVVEGSDFVNARSPVYAQLDMTTAR